MMCCHSFLFSHQTRILCSVYGISRCLQMFPYEVKWEQTHRSDVSRNTHYLSLFASHPSLHPKQLMSFQYYWRSCIENMHLPVCFHSLVSSQAKLTHAGYDITRRLRERRKGNRAAVSFYTSFSQKPNVWQRVLKQCHNAWLQDQNSTLTSLKDQLTHITRHTLWYSLLEGFSTQML